MQKGGQIGEPELLVQLLIGSGLVSRDDIDDFKSIAKDLKIPLTQAIINAGILSQQNLRLCVEAYNRIQQRELKVDMAIRAVRIAVQRKCSLGAAIGSVKKLHQTTRVVVPAANELTDLLLSAKIISNEQIGNIFKQAEDSSVMIGQLLVIDGLLSTDSLLDALNAVRLIREAELEKAKAVKALAYANERSVSFEQALFELSFFVPPDARAAQVAELFTMSGLLTKKDLAECYEIELFKKKPFGQILLERGLVTRSTSTPLFLSCRP